MEESWRRKWKAVRMWNVIVWKGDSFSLFCLLAPLDCASDPLGLKHSLRTLPTPILPAYRSTMLTARVFVTRDTLRHPRRFVFGKFVRKPNCSWSEAFVNRGLAVYRKTEYKFLPNISVATRHHQDVHTPTDLKRNIFWYNKNTITIFTVSCKLHCYMHVRDVGSFV